MTGSRSDAVFSEIQKEVDAIYRQLMRYPWTDRRAYASTLERTRRF